MLHESGKSTGLDRTIELQFDFLFAMLMLKIPREIGLGLFSVVERLRAVVSRKL